MSTKSPAPAAACADFALLLPLASHGLLDPTDRAALARHLDTCAHCRGELAFHDQTDAALRQALGQGPAAAAPWTRSEILSLLVEDSPVAIVTGHAVSPPLTALGVQPSRAIMAAPRVAARNNARGPARPHGSIGTIAAALLVALLAGTLFALAQDRGGPTGTRAPASLPAGLAVQAVAMISPTEGWAAGSVTAVPYYPKLVVLHYAAGRWSVALVALPSALGRQSAVLTGIAMVSPTEGWAVGHTVLGHAPGGEVDGWTSGILLHDVGGTWRDANAAGAPWDALNRAGGYQLLDVVADRSGTAWIVGTDGTGAALVLRGGAAGWARMSDPALAGVAPTAAAADPAGGLWIAGVDDTAGPGFDGNAPGVVLHFDGRVWTRPPLPDPRIRVAGLAPTASGTVWAVGTLPGQASEGGGADLAHPGVAVVLRGGSGVWTVAVRFASPSGAPTFGFADVALAPDDTGWAVGMDGALAHLVGGRWERVASPTSQDLLCVALTSSADGWAFGADGVILRATGGVWRRYGQ